MIFSIAMGAGYSFYMKSIETHARAFLALIILSIGTVQHLTYLSGDYVHMAAAVATVAQQRSVYLRGNRK